MFWQFIQGEVNLGEFQQKIYRLCNLCFTDFLLEAFFDNITRIQLLQVYKIALN